MNTIWAPEVDPAITPKFKAVAREIQLEAEDGMLQVGHSLPPVRKLGLKLTMAPGTIARAYTILRQDGLLFAEVGRGACAASANSLLQRGS